MGKTAYRRADFIEPLKSLPSFAKSSSSQHKLIDQYLADHIDEVKSLPDSYRPDASSAQRDARLRAARYLCTDDNSPEAMQAAEDFALRIRQIVRTWYTTLIVATVENVYGWGVFAAAPIKKNTVIGVYRGYPLRKTSWASFLGHGKSFVYNGFGVAYCMDAYISSWVGVEDPTIGQKPTIINAAAYKQGAVARYINHAVNGRSFKI